MQKNQLIGKLGEDIAVDYLEKSGYRILERNIRIRRSEIDIICKKEGILVFVEVKTRNSGHYGYPEEAIMYSKAKSVIAGASVYLQKQSDYIDVRFDVISVKPGSAEEILHFKDAFY